MARTPVLLPGGYTPAQLRSLKRSDFGGPQIKMTVQTNARQLAELMLTLKREQVPFAFAVALTRVAFEGRDEVRGKLRTHFTLRNQRVRQGIQVNRAEKTDWPRPVAEVGTLDEFMAPHVEGGVKRPQMGASHIAVPTKIVTRTGTGAVKASEKPTPLRARRGVFVEGTGNKLSIRERTEKKSGRVVVGGKRVTVPSRLANLGFATWFLLRPSVKLKPRWPIVDEVGTVVGDRIGYHFERELDRACRSARSSFGTLTSDMGRRMYVAARGISIK